jgi:hypothetical protein
MISQFDFFLKSFIKSNFTYKLYALSPITAIVFVYEHICCIFNLFAIRRIKNKVLMISRVRNLH